MAIEFDYANHLINITSPQNTLSCQDLIDAIRTQEATEAGIRYPQIATASGKELLDVSTAVGLTVFLISPWQVKFWGGNYIAKIAGGNLVGGIAGDPVAYSAGVQVLLVQSVASTVVTTAGGSGLSAEQDATLTAALAAAQNATLEAAKGRKMQTNKAIISGDEQTVHIYDDDGTTLLHTFSVTADKKTRVPV